ncbi:hypothetical protein KFE25_003099 [Diacronema lutheri]|uniref:Kinesin-like protein n=1 Tax=Diacronema lutheri TaxID=2081491 RepID=A0A8J5X5Y3_DIALT|nr:hypothetical protein KFE25_003099 [Diacronema lutheri]
MLSPPPGGAPVGGAPKRGATGVVSTMMEMERKREERRARMEEERKRRDVDAAEAADRGGVDSLDFIRMIDAYRAAKGVPTEPTCWAGPRTVWDLPTRSKIRVCVRKRPMLSRERERREFDSLTVHPPGPGSELAHSTTVHENKLRVDTSKSLDNHEFQFDACFSERDTNTHIFGAVGMPQMIDHVLAGHSATVFCFGQTGSGKTVTMMGLSGQHDGADGTGLYGLATRALFERKAAAQAAGGYRLAVLISFYEIYRGCVRDLLNRRQRLNVRDDAKGRTWIAGLTITRVDDATAVETLIQAAHAARATSATAANATSSRSHAVLQVRACLDADAERALANGGGGGGKLCLVDLAGSERASDAASADQSTRIEGAEINKSLLCLKECIRALDAGQRHTPFRGSKLTHVLRNSFMGDARTVMIANVAPGSASVENTLNSLRYAARVKDMSQSGEAVDGADGGAETPLLMATPLTGEQISALPPPVAAPPGGAAPGAPSHKKGARQSRKAPAPPRPQSAPSKRAAAAPTSDAISSGPPSPLVLGQTTDEEASEEGASGPQPARTTPAPGRRPPSPRGIAGPLAKVSGMLQRAFSRSSRESLDAAPALEQDDEQRAIEMLRYSAAADGSELPDVDYMATISALSQAEQAMIEQHRQALVADEALLRHERALLSEMDEVDRSTSDYVRDLEAIIAAKVELSMALQGQLLQFKLQLQREEKHNQRRLSRVRAQTARQSALEA